MTYNDNTTAQTLLFPIQIIESSDERMKLEIPEMVLQFRLAYFRVQRRILNNEVISEEEKQDINRHIKNGNEAIDRYSYPPLPMLF
jgi:hypothetical protein